MKILYTIFLLFIVSHFSFSQVKPDWVNNHPIDTNYYIGIAFGDKASSNYIEVAKKNALLGIASEISTKISGESLLSSKEDNNSFKSTYTSTIKSQIVNEIDGYELVGVWQDARYYWVYYRLNKAKYLESLSKKIVNDYNLAYSFFKDIDEERDYTKKLSLAFSSYALIQDNLKRQYIPEYTEKSWQLFENAQKIIFEILSRIELSVSNKNINSFLGKTLEEPLVLVANYMVSKDEARVMSNLPIRYRFLNGNGILRDTILYTDLKGLCNNTLVKVLTFEPTSHVVAELALDRLININGYKELDFISFTNKIPRTKYLIKVEKTNIIIVSNELNHNQIIDQAILANKMSSLLFSAGYNIVNIGGNFEYKISIKSNTRKGSIINGIYISFLDFEIIVTNKKGDMVYSNSKNGIKGLKLNFYDSGLDAYNRSLSLIEKEMFENIIQSITKE